MWFNKEYVTNLSDIEHHPEIVKKLKNIKQISNMVFYGPPGCGKLTLVKNMLTNTLNIDTKKSLLKKLTLDIAKTNKNITIWQNQYYYYIDMSLFDNKIENYIFNEFISNLIKSKNIVQKFHLFVIHNIHKKNNIAFVFLKSFLSKYSNNARFIIITENIQLLQRNKIDTFFIKIRVPLIKIENLEVILNNIYKTQTNKKLNKQTLKSICKQTSNLSKAISLLQMKYQNNYEFKQYINREKKKYDKIYKVLANKKKQPIQNVTAIKTFIYDNYTILGMEHFIKDFLDYIIKKIKVKDKIYKLISFANKIDHNMQKINKEIILYEYYLLNINNILIS